MNEIVKIEFSNEQLNIIKSVIAKDATDNELALFINQCKRTGLDPISRQIYFMKRSGKVTIQTSIDGFRAIAERSGDYAGQDEPQFEESNGHPVKATVKVYRWRGDQRYCAAVGVAYYNEYCPQQGQDFMWKKMPHTMLSKVAEALALRKAYPQDLSGLYTGEEMQQAEKIEDYVDVWQYTPQRQERLTQLLTTSTYEQGSKAYKSIQANIDAVSIMAEDLYHKIENNLVMSQQDPIVSGQPYNQSDISKHLKEKVA